MNAAGTEAALRDLEAATFATRPDDPHTMFMLGMRLLDSEGQLRDPAPRNPLLLGLVGFAEDA